MFTSYKEVKNLTLNLTFILILRVLHSQGEIANSLLLRKQRNIERKRAAREAGWTGRMRQGGRCLREKGSGRNSWTLTPKP
jgi:hypothetical protein